MEFEYSLISEPPGDDVRTLKPLPCYGRGLPLIPLEELPLFQYLKRDYEMAQPVNASREVPSGIGRGSVSKLSGFSMEDYSDEDHNVVSLYWQHQKPLSASNLNAGLEPSRRKLHSLKFCGLVKFCSCRTAVLECESELTGKVFFFFFLWGRHTLSTRQI